MKTGVRGVIRDILIIYICIRLIFVWLFNAKFDFVLGIMIILLGLSAIWFMIEIGLVG
jgi:hypothetical protein